jgi:hypothetical protein
MKARARGGAAMIGVTDKMILMPQVQIPEDAMKEFGANMRVEKIPVTGFKVNRYTGVPNLLRIRVEYVGGFVRLPKRRITRRSTAVGRNDVYRLRSDSQSRPFRSVSGLHESNYSIYSINGGFEGRPRGISELGCLVSTPWTHKSFIDKRRLTSQAGRRGFEPHLPLHVFNNLQGIANYCD